jgi:hypothetical protein
MEDEKICVVCYEKEYVKYTNCCHTVCLNCIPKLQKPCPICRGKLYFAYSEDELKIEKKSMTLFRKHYYNPEKKLSRFE